MTRSAKKTCNLYTAQPSRAAHPYHAITILVCFCTNKTIIIGRARCTNSRAVVPLALTETVATCTFRPPGDAVTTKAQRQTLSKRGSDDASVD